jgi:antitoxin YefM
MNSVDLAEAKENLETLCEEAASTREPITVLRPGRENIVIVAADEWAGYLETAHLLSSDANAKRLLAALERSWRREGTAMTLAEIESKFASHGTDSGSGIP